MASGTAGARSATEHTLTYFQPPGTGQDHAASTYKFEVAPDGSPRADDALGAVTDETVGAVRPNFVRGAVPGGPDSYVFTGEVVWSVAGDSVGIILDGEEVTAGDLGDVWSTRRRACGIEVVSITSVYLCFYTMGSPAPAVNTGQRAGRPSPRRSGHGVDDGGRG